MPVLINDEGITFDRGASIDRVLWKDLREVAIETNDQGPWAEDVHYVLVPRTGDLEAFRPAGLAAAEPRVVFAGVMNYAPNEEDALWLAREVWPLVLARRPEARLTLLGSDPTRAVRALAGLHASIEVTGRVPDVRPNLWRAAVAAAPLHTARGVQNKVLEAAAAGLPPVVTPAVAEGLPPEIAGACAVAGTPEPFAAALVDLLGRPLEERRGRGARARRAEGAAP